MTESATADLRASVVEAAASLLRDGGYAAVTTRAVAAAAGVQAPAIYRLFGDKEGLMAAVAERAMALYAAHEAELAAEGDRDPVDELRRAWHAHIGFGLANPDLYVLLAQPNHPTRSAATAAGIDVLTQRVSRVAASGRLRVPVAQAVRMIHAAGTGVVLALLDDPPALRDESLPNVTLDAILTSLLTDQPAPAADDHAALVVAFTAALPQLPGLSEAERQLLREWLQRMVTASPPRPR